MALSILTRTEAKLVRAVPEHEGTPLYELASREQLTPTEVGNTVSRLVSKQFAELIEDGRMVKLTEEGRRVRRLLEGQRKLNWSLPNLLVVPDEASEGIDEAAEFEESDIDKALDAEISSRSEEASA
jgi:DNA-binding MarR family transcriptional regulator